MRNFKEFIDRKVAVVFDSEKEIDKFYELCVKNNKINESIITRKDDVLKSFVYFSKEYQIPLINYYGGEDYLKVKASEFLTQSTTTIEIFQSKQTVICLKKLDGKVVAVGKAKCNPDDAFDFEFGATLAFQRMIGMEPLKPPFDISDCEQGIKTLKNGMKIRKQDRYEVGDKVLMKKKTNLTLCGEMRDCVGKVCTIKGFDGTDIELEESGTFLFTQFDIKGKVIQ